MFASSPRVDPAHCHWATEEDIEKAVSRAVRDEQMRIAEELYKTIVAYRHKVFFYNERGYEGKRTSQIYLETVINMERHIDNLALLSLYGGPI